MRCHYCPCDDSLTMVGFAEQGSGPGYTYYACPACRRSRRLMPFAEHPPTGDGTPRRYPSPHPAVAFGDAIAGSAIVVTVAWAVLAGR